MISNRPITVHASNTSLLLTPRGAVALQVWQGQYPETEVLERLISLLPSNATFVDVGANVGLYAIGVARAISGATVYALEPCADTYATLSKNIQLNQANVIAANVAIADYLGRGQLWVNTKGKDGLNSIRPPSHPDASPRSLETVDVTTLDEFAQSRMLSQVDATKIDVEGAELLVLKGAKSLLAADNAPIIILEAFSWCTRAFGYHPVELAWQLSNYGYRVFGLDQQGTVITDPSRELWDLTILALKPNHPSFSRLQEWKQT